MPVSGSSVPAPRFESNPFCTRFVRPGQIPYRFPVHGIGDNQISPSEIVDSLITCQAGSIVGPHGTGKSTLLHTLRPYLENHFSKITQVQLCAAQNNSWLRRHKQARTNATKILAMLAGDHKDDFPQFDNTELYQNELTASGTSRADLIIIDGIEQLSASSRHRLIRQANKNSQTILATSHRDLRGLQTLYRTYATQQIVQQLTESLLTDQSLQLQSRIQQELAKRTIDSSTNVRELWFDMYDLCVADLSVSDPDTIH